MKPRAFVDAGPWRRRAVLFLAFWPLSCTSQSAKAHVELYGSGGATKTQLGRVRFCLLPHPPARAHLKMQREKYFESRSCDVEGAQNWVIAGRRVCRRARVGHADLSGAVIMVVPQCTTGKITMG